MLFSALVFRTADGDDVLAPVVTDAQLADQPLQLSLRALGVTG